MQIAGIILAAGQSTRMGAFKPLLDVDGTPILLHEVELFRSCGLRQIIVVTGHNADAVERLLHKTCPDVETAYNARYREDMYTSVCAGVRSVQAGMDGVFILPSDCPGVSVATLLHMLDHYKSNTGRILYPQCGERRGHPPLIPARLLPELLAWPGDGGLGAFLRGHSSLNIPIPDQHVLNDLDTAEQFASFLVSARSDM